MGINWEYKNWQVLDWKLKKCIDKLPIQCKKKYAVFKHVTEFSGLNGLMKYPGFNLEKLKGELKDKYSIRLNISYRVVFSIDESQKTININEVSKHEYK